MQAPSAEQPVEALRGNATFNKINKAANREMRMLHVLEEKFKLKDPKSSEVKHLSVQFCSKMQLVCLRDGCLHQLSSNKDCTRNEYLSLSRYTLCKCPQRNWAVLAQGACLKTPPLHCHCSCSNTGYSHTDWQAVSADTAGQHIVSPWALFCSTNPEICEAALPYFYIYKHIHTHIYIFR